MTVENTTDRAQARAHRERDHVAGEQRAYEQFRRRVASVSSADGRQQLQSTGSGLGGIQSMTAPAECTDSDATACRQVREAFDETVRPYSVEDIGDESLLTTIREELGDGIALALAPTTDHGVTAQTKQAIFTVVSERLADLDATLCSLDQEVESLGGAATEVERITDWLATADEQSLLGLRFEQLQARHERLAAFRNQCQCRLETRQELLQETSSQNPWPGQDHRSLVGYLYQEHSVEYPVLSTMTQLDDRLADRQRAVRDQLIGRN